MMIRLTDIEKLFCDYDTTIYMNSTPDQCVCGFYKINDSEELFSQHYLFVTNNWEHILNVNDISNYFFLVIENKNNLPPIEEQMPTTGNILAVHTDDETAITQILFRYFNFQCGRGLFAESLLDILFSEGGIQAMIDRVYPAFQNPIYVFDGNFNLLAANWEQAKVYHNTISSNMLETRHFSDNEFQLINQLEHVHERLKKSETPILIHHEEVGFDQMLCAIDTKKDIGHIGS